MTLILQLDCLSSSSPPRSSLMNATILFSLRRTSLARTRLFTTATNSRSSDVSSSNVVVVFTDGACKKNGRHDSTAGIGVWFAKGDERNVSQRLEGEPQTNQRAELAAAIAALERVRDDQRVEVRSDSKYVVMGVSSWLQRWRVNGFVSAKGTRVANLDLWRELDRLLQLRKKNCSETRFVWVPAHDGVPGNEDADALASAAAAEGSAKQAAENENKRN